MSRRCAVHLARVAALLGISVSALSATAPSAADLARCAGIAAPDARLACYDTLAGRAADRAAPTAATTPTPAPVAPPPPASAAPPTAAAAAATSATPAAPPVPPASAPAPSFASDPRNFGFTEAQQHAQAQPHAAPEAPANIQARVAKFVDNRAGRAYVVLDNGQTWVFVDAGDDAGLSPGDAVTIKRASLGSFLILTPSKHALHVRRLQ
jgi:hypothetical protein